MNAQSDFRASLKSLDTEENIDIYFYRHLGWFWAKIARRLHITPNAITIASIFIGIAAGVCFYPANILVNIGGLLLLVLANSFDSADGQLARLTGQYSRLGRILDGLAGDFWFVTIYVCICLRSIHTIGFFGLHPWTIWLTALLAGASHVVQAALADYYRQMHLQCINGKSELETSAHIRQNAAKASGAKRLMLKAYALYTRCQELLTPQAGKILLTPHFCTPEFRRGSLPLMKYANALTFNWRSICLAMTLLAGQPWLYFIIEITVFNLLMLYMRHRHEALCRTLRQQPPVEDDCI